TTGAVGPAVRHVSERRVPASLRQRRVQADPRRTDAHPVPRRSDQAVLHLPQPGLPPGPARHAQARAPGMAAVRLVLPGAAPRRRRVRGMDSVAALGQARKVPQMTFTDAAAQSKTFTRAWGDLLDGYRKRELWLHLGWQDIKQKYR